MLKEVPPYATVVGVPGKIVRIRVPHQGDCIDPDLQPECDEAEWARQEELAKEAARLAEEERSKK